MRLWRFALVCLVVIVPTLGRGEIMVLKDGSSFKGRLIKFVNDTLYFQTSFGAELRVGRDTVARIEFGDSMMTLQRAMTGSAPPGANLTASAPGTLLVAFDRVKVSSTISVRRDKDRKGHERENAISAILIVDGRTVYTAVDSTSDKIIKNGDEVLVRNRMKPEAIKVGLSAGLHEITIILANRRAGKYRERLENGGLDKRVRRDNVLIIAGETRRLTVGLRRKTLGLRGSELYVGP